MHYARSRHARTFCVNAAPPSPFPLSAVLNDFVSVLLLGSFILSSMCMRHLRISNLGAAAYHQYQHFFHQQRERVFTVGYLSLLRLVTTLFFSQRSDDCALRFVHMLSFLCLLALACVDPVSLYALRWFTYFLSACVDKWRSSSLSS